jgi:hypothetical protein
MLQQIIIGFVFLAALGYVGRLIYRSFQAKHACSTGCAKCSAVDVEKIERQLESRA